MTFLQKMKSDKKYRIKVVVVVALLFMFAVSSFGEKKEAEYESFDECYQVNKILTPAQLTILIPFGYTFTVSPIWEWPGDGKTKYGVVNGLSDQKKLCKSQGCYIAEIIRTGGNPQVCVPYVPNGWVHEESDDPNEACLSGVSEGGVCREKREGDVIQVCNTAEKPIAKVIQSIGLSKTNCKNAYYIAIFGGVFLLLLVFAAM